MIRVGFMEETCWFYSFRPGADLRVTDEDAADFLQSQFSNELRPFEAGRATYGLWLDVKGKVRADSVVLCLGEESFRLVSDHCDGAAIRQHLEAHIIADDVVIEPVAGGTVFELSAATCAELGLALPEAGLFAETEHGCLWHAPESSYRLLVAADSAAAALRKRLFSAGCRELSDTDRGLLRIAAGRSRIPEEIGPADLPGEGELESTAIAFTKGCYLGQEVVARMHNLGQAQRRLFLVEGASKVPQVPLPLYNSASKHVGELRSAYPSDEGWRGVALLKRRFVKPGDVLNSGDQSIAVRHPLNEGSAP